MNPLEGCSKGYRKCIKTCYQPEKCQPCPYLKECCHRYCVIFPPASSKAIDEETGQMRPEIFAECIDFILKGKGSLTQPAYELLSSMGLINPET